jgi:O-antigen ligase
MLADALRAKRPHRLGLPLLVAGGGAALEAIVALSAARHLAPLVAAAVVGVGLLYLILRRPGVVPYLALAWLVFEKVAELHLAFDPARIDALGDALLVVALAWTLLVNLLRRRVPLFTMRQIGPPLLAFLGLGVASAVINDVPVPIAALGILSPTHSLLIFLSLVNIGVQARDVSRFVSVAVAVTAIIGLVAVLQAVPGSPAWYLAATQPPDSTHGGYVRVSGIFGDPISLGDFLAVVLPLGLMLLFFGPGRGRQRTVLLLANLVMLLALLLTFTRGAWGSVLIGALVLGLTVERKLWWATLTYVLPGVVALGLLFEPIANRLQETVQGNLRFTLFRDTLPLIRDHLWFGVGPGRFGGHIALITGSPLYAEYHFPAFAYATGGQVDMFWTHTVAESGLLGTAAYLAIIGSCFVVGRRAYRQAVTPARKALLLGLLYVIPVAVFVSLFSSVLEAGPPATLFWALMGLLTALANTPEGPSVAGSPDHAG